MANIRRPTSSNVVRDVGNRIDGYIRTKSKASKHTVIRPAAGSTNGRNGSAYRTSSGKRGRMQG